MVDTRDSGAGTRGPRGQRELATAFRTLTAWQWRVQSFDSWTLLLIADVDLTYHHSVEVRFHGAQYIGLTTHEFYDPQWTEPTADELRAYGTSDPLPQEIPPTVFTWTITDGHPAATAIVSAERVDIVRGHWPHHGR